MFTVHHPARAHAGPTDIPAVESSAWQHAPRPMRDIIAVGARPVILSMANNHRCDPDIIRKLFYKDRLESLKKHMNDYNFIHSSHSNVNHSQLITCLRNFPPAFPRDLNNNMSDPVNNDIQRILACIELLPMHSAPPTRLQELLVNTQWLAPGLHAGIHSPRPHSWNNNCCYKEMKNAIFRGLNAKIRECNLLIFPGTSATPRGSTAQPLPTQFASRELDIIFYQILKDDKIAKCILLLNRSNKQKQLDIFTLEHTMKLLTEIYKTVSSFISSKYKLKEKLTDLLENELKTRIKLNETPTQAIIESYPNQQSSPETPPARVDILINNVSKTLLSAYRFPEELSTQLRVEHSDQNVNKMRAHMKRKRRH